MIEEKDYNIEEKLLRDHVMNCEKIESTINFIGIRQRIPYSIEKLMANNHPNSQISKISKIKVFKSLRNFTFLAGTSMPIVKIRANDEKCVILRATKLSYKITDLYISKRYIFLSGYTNEDMLGKYSETASPFNVFNLNLQLVYNINPLMRTSVENLFWVFEPHLCKKNTTKIHVSYSWALGGSYTDTSHMSNRLKLLTRQKEKQSDFDRKKKDITILEENDFFEKYLELSFARSKHLKEGEGKYCRYLELMYMVDFKKVFFCVNKVQWLSKHNNFAYYQSESFFHSCENPGAMRNYKINKIEIDDDLIFLGIHESKERSFEVYFRVTKLDMDKRKLIVIKEFKKDFNPLLLGKGLRMKMFTFIPFGYNADMKNFKRRGQGYFRTNFVVQSSYFFFFDFENNDFSYIGTLNFMVKEARVVGKNLVECFHSDFPDIRLLTLGTDKDLIYSE